MLDLLQAAAGKIGTVNYGTHFISDRLWKGGLPHRPRRCRDYTHWQLRRSILEADRFVTIRTVSLSLMDTMQFLCSKYTTRATIIGVQHGSGRSISVSAHGVVLARIEYRCA